MTTGGAAIGLHSYLAKRVNNFEDKIFLERRPVNQNRPSILKSDAIVAKLENLSIRDSMSTINDARTKQSKSDSSRIASSVDKKKSILDRGPSNQIELDEILSSGDIAPKQNDLLQSSVLNAFQLILTFRPGVSLKVVEGASYDIDIQTRPVASSWTKTLSALEKNNLRKRCYSCGSAEHLKNDCVGGASQKIAKIIGPNVFDRKVQTGLEPSYGRRPRLKRICYICRKQGHKAKNCTESRVKNNDSSDRRSTINVGLDNQKEYM